MTVAQGPWSGPAVVQTAEQPRGRWWKRVDGVLWVWCGDGRLRRAPVEPVELKWPLPDRPPNVDRITCALDLRMMDGPEVDEALGVADALDTVVDAWEAGEAVPTQDEIRRLARLTGMLPAWFYNGSLPKADQAFVCRMGG